MGWQDDAIVQAAPAAAEPQPWEKDAIVAPATGPRAAEGLTEAWNAGYQGSVVGLTERGKLPDIVLDSHHNAWYEKLVGGVSQLIGDVPAMLPGAAAGGAGGAAVGGAVGSVVPGLGTAVGAAAGGLIGGGAGAFAAPTAVRTGLMQFYEQRDGVSSADFLARTGIVIKATAKDALVGGMLGPVAKFTGGATAGLGRVGQAAAVTGAEVGTMTVAPAALEGRLPEPDDFWNGAIMVVGIKGATHAAARMRQIYAETGRRPEQVVADARADPTIAADLAAPPVPEKFDLTTAFEGKPELGRGEQSVVYDNGSSVLKVMKPSQEPAAFQRRVNQAIAISNLVGDGTTRLQGYTETDGVRSPVLSQAKVEGRPATREEIRDHMAERGFTVEREGQNTDVFAKDVDGTKVTIFDLRGDNVKMTADGQVKVIDAAIQFKGADGKRAPIPESVLGGETQTAPKIPDELQPLATAAKQFPTFEEFRNHFEPGSMISFDRQTFIKDEAHQPSQNALFHGAPTESVMRILEKGEISPRISAGDQAGERAVSLTPFRQLAASRDSVAFEIDPAKTPTRPAPEGVMGEGGAGTEVRSDSAIPLSSIRRVIVEVGKKEGPNTVIGYRGAQQEPITVQNVMDAAKAKGLDAVMVKVGTDLRAIYDAAHARGEAEIPRAYQPLALATNINDAVPGVKAENAGQQLLGPLPPVPGEPSPTHVNYDTLHTPDAVKGTMAQISAIYEAEIQSQRRGTVTWEQTQAEAGKVIADMLGSTEPFQPRQPGTAAGAAELLARKQMLQGSAEDLAAKRDAYLAIPPEQRSPQLKAEYLAAVERTAMIQAEFLGARAEVGRAMNILKNTKIAARRAEAIQDLLARYGKDPDQLAEMMSHLDNPTAVLKFAKEAAAATTWEKIVEAWKAGLVSGPVTQVANIMGNLSFAATRPLVDVAAYGVGLGHEGLAKVGMLSSPAERVSAAEPLARVLGNIQGAWDGMSMARVAFLEDVPAGKSGEQFRTAIGGKTGYIVRTPFRALSAMDALFRNMAERGEANAIAARQAAAEGHNPATREFRERMVEITQNLTEEQQQAVSDMGERLVFQAPLGSNMRIFQKLVHDTHSEWMVPFTGTPTNVFKEMARHSPLAPIVGEWRADVAAGGARAQRAFAEMAVGTAISTMAASWAFSGNMTGAGDPDPNKRRAQMAAGWQPYSIKIGGKWYSYQRVQPIGTLLGMAADMATVWDHMTPEESDKLPKIIGTAFANAVTNQTFLQGITNIVQALADPDRFLPKFVQQMAASPIPAVVGQTAALMDPYQREVNSVKEAVQNRIPGLREQLTPSRDIFGEPAASPDRLGGISPITTKAISEDPVRKEAARLGVGNPEAPKKIEVAGGRVLGKAAQMTLTPEQRDIFGSTAGQLAHQILTPMVNSPGWAYMPDAVKAIAIKTVFEKTNSVGKTMALTPEERAQEIGRITGEIAKKLQPPAQ